jgi:cyclophilin family peptidyl-prolyl cis-trans isomerase
MRLTILLLAVSLIAACGGATNSNSTRSNTNAEVKKGVAPVADNEVAVIEMETPAYGTIKMELYSNVAPKAVARFKELAKEGYYNGIAFHRVNQTVIQAGDANTKPGGTAGAMKRAIPENRMSRRSSPMSRMTPDPRRRPAWQRRQLCELAVLHHAQTRAAVRSEVHSVRQSDRGNEQRDDHLRRAAEGRRATRGTGSDKNDKDRAKVADGAPSGVRLQFPCFSKRANWV